MIYCHLNHDVVEAEKAGRDGRSAEELYRRVQRLHEEESKGVQGSLRDLSERLDAVTKQKELEATKRADAQEQVKELRAAAEKLRVTVRTHCFILCARTLPSHTLNFLADRRPPRANQSAGAFT